MGLLDVCIGDFIMTVVQTLSLIMQLYTTLIRPHLGYAAPIWVPFTASNINKSENPALKVCTNHWNLGYQDILVLLSKVAVYICVYTLYKIVHNLVYFSPNVISPKYISVTPEPFLHQPFARTAAYYSSFVPYLE